MVALTLVHKNISIARDSLKRLIIMARFVERILLLFTTYRMYRTIPYSLPLGLARQCSSDRCHALVVHLSLFVEVDQVQTHLRQKKISGPPFP